MVAPYDGHSWCLRDKVFSAERGMTTSNSSNQQDSVCTTGRSNRQMCGGAKSRKAKQDPFVPIQDVLYIHHRDRE